MNSKIIEYSDYEKKMIDAGLAFLEKHGVFLEFNGSEYEYNIVRKLGLDIEYSMGYTLYVEKDGTAWKL